jgi:hypothetical protein
VNALHDDDDAARLLVVGSRHQRRAIPLDATRAGGLRMGIVEFERIIDDEEIAAAPRKRSLDRGCITTSAEGGVKVIGPLAQMQFVSRSDLLSVSESGERRVDVVEFIEIYNERLQRLELNSMT